MKIILFVWLFLLGAVMGSFVCCQTWRLRYRELKKKDLGKRSVCLNCGYKLKWYDNLPIVSWLMLRGKCRKCREKIGVAEIVAEAGMGLVFLLYGMTTSDEWWMMILMLLMICILGFLAIYDGKWGELPTKQLIMAIVVGLVISVVKITTCKAEIWSVLAGIGILAGIYYILYIASREKLVGGGDWMLGLAIALAVSDWWLALWVMFLANMIGTIVAMPDIIKRKKKKIYFGPYLVVAFVIVIVFAKGLTGLIGF